MKYLSITALFITIFFYGTLVTKADSWYDPYVNLHLSVDCSTMTWTGGEQGVSPDPNISDWVDGLYEDERCEPPRFEGEVTFRGACPVMDNSPTGSFYLYNDLFDMNSCPGDWTLF